MKKNYFLLASLPISYRLDEFHDGVSLRFVEVAELLSRPTSLALGVAVPHDGSHHVTGAAVVQAVAVSGARAHQALAPKRGGAAPARADVILHED